MDAKRLAEIEATHDTCVQSGECDNCLWDERYNRDAGDLLEEVKRLRAALAAETEACAALVEGYHDCESTDAGWTLRERAKGGGQ